MSNLVLCQAKSQFDKYATAKSNGQLFLTGGLFADTVKDLYVLALQSDHIEQNLWYIILVVVVLSLLLELIGGGISLYLSFQVYPCVMLDGSIECGPDPDGECPMTDITASANNGANNGSSSEDPDKAPAPPVAAECPKHMKLLNDLLTSIHFVLLTLTAVKNALHTTRTVPEKTTEEPTVPSITKQILHLS